MNDLPEALHEGRRLAWHMHAPLENLERSPDLVNRIHAQMRHETCKKLWDMLIPGRHYVVKIDVIAEEQNHPIDPSGQLAPGSFFGGPAMLFATTIYAVPVEYKDVTIPIMRPEDMTVQQLGRTALQEIKHRLKKALTFRRQPT